MKQPYKDLTHHKDLLYSVHYHGDTTSKVALYDFNQVGEEEFVVQVDNSFGLNVECYDLYYRGSRFNATAKLLGSDEDSLTIQFNT